MQCAKLTVCLTLPLLSFGALCDDSLDNYYSKVEECIAFEKSKPDLTEEQVSLNEMKYLPLVRSMRIEDCSREEELDYIDNTKSSDLKVTLSAYNKRDLSKLSEDEVALLEELNNELEGYNLETDLLAIYEKLEIQQKQRSNDKHN